MNFHGWLLSPEGAHLPALRMVVMSSLGTFACVNSRMLRLDRIVSIVPGIANLRLMVNVLRSKIEIDAG
ncbi:hypothetical protein Mpsy_0757 [Methanolobus psychrophilus R15]|nr:hypothetical protein Mpsy_0757 [Methanolobus psychrophilus R15]